MKLKSSGALRKGKKEEETGKSEFAKIQGKAAGDKAEREEVSSCRRFPFRAE